MEGPVGNVRMAAEHGLEIEAKLHVAEFDDVRTRLRQAGATCVGRVLETNRFFDRPDAMLQKFGCGLRVRSLQVLEGAGASPTMTFKGRMQPGPLKIRPECEVQVDDADAAASLLAQLGFVQTVSFQKRRESWRCGPCLVELDELPHIGRFVEIEGPSQGDVECVRGRLGFDAAVLERSSYLALIARHCEAHGLDASRVTFS